MGKKWDSSGIAYDVDVWQQCLRVLKPGGHILAFGGSRTFHRLAVAIEDAGYEIRDTIAWISSKTFPKSLNVAKAIAKQGKDGSKAEGWGTGLKQVVEPVVLARKPLEGTVADNFLRWGVGGLNIDASRIGHEEVTINTFDNGAKPFGNAVGEAYTSRVSTGRWPANVLLDEEAAQTVDKQSGASRFFYVATASKKDRNEGLNTRNTHPTVKPVALMQYLIRLITPPGGLVLDPFTGSGSTGKAALLYGYGFIGAELTDEYLPIIEGRLKWALDNKDEGLF
jgi:site-specific DNA-methyltransferase (adenine-specific)